MRRVARERPDGLAYQPDLRTVGEERLLLDVLGAYDDGSSLATSSPPPSRCSPAGGSPASCSGPAARPAAAGPATGSASGTVAGSARRRVSGPAAGPTSAPAAWPG